MGLKQPTQPLGGLLDTGLTGRPSLGHGLQGTVLFGPAENRFIQG